MPQRRVLLVDDDHLIRRAMCRVLECRGYPTVAVGTQDEALEILARDRFAVAIVDLNLRGGHSGTSLVQAMRREGDRTPVVAFSGAPHSDPRARLMARDCAVFLSKPASSDELIRAIERAVATRPESGPSVPQRRGA